MEGCSQRGGTSSGKDRSNCHYYHPTTWKPLAFVKDPAPWSVQHKPTCKRCPTRSSLSVPAASCPLTSLAVSVRLTALTPQVWGFARSSSGNFQAPFHMSSSQIWAFKCKVPFCAGKGARSFLAERTRQRHDNEGLLQKERPDCIFFFEVSCQILLASAQHVRKQKHVGCKGHTTDSGLGQNHLHDAGTPQREGVHVSMQPPFEKGKSSLDAVALK